MGIDYNIRLAEPITPADAKSLIANHFGYSNLIDGVTSFDISPPSQLRKELTREQFAIEEVLTIYCRIDKFDARRGMENFIELFVGLLVLLDTDMVVDFNGEKPILFRRSGIVYVDLRDRYWREKLAPRLAEVGLPFVERAMDVDQSLCE